MQLGGGIGDRALGGKPRPEGVEEDIFFFGWQVIELAQDDGCHLLRYFGCADGGNSEHRVVEHSHTSVLAAAGVQCDAGVAQCLPGVGQLIELGLTPTRLMACLSMSSSIASRVLLDGTWAMPT